MAWEVLSRHSKAAPLGPHCRLSRTGTVTISPEAADVMGSAEHIELHFDREQLLLGLRPLAQRSNQSYRFKRMPAGGITIPCKTNLARLAAFGPLVETWLPAHLEDGRLVFGPIVRRPDAETDHGPAIDAALVRGVVRRANGYAPPIGASRA